MECKGTDPRIRTFDLRWVKWLSSSPSCFKPVDNIPGTDYIGVCLGFRGGLEAMEKGLVFCPRPKSNHGSAGILPVA
jgi:hypothetical protein